MKPGMWPFPWHTRLQIRLALVLSFAVLALLAADAFDLLTTRRQAIDTAKSETANLARSLAYNAHDIYQTVDTVLVGLRERVEAGDADAVSLPLLVNFMALQRRMLPNIDQLAVLDASGHVMAQSGEAQSGALPTSGMAFSGQRFFRAHLDSDNRNGLMGWPVRATSDAAWVLTVSRRVNHPDGRFAGVVVACVRASLFENLYAHLDIGSNGVFLLVRSDATVMARWPRVNRTSRIDVSKGALFTAALPHARAGTFEGRSPIDGILRLNSYETVENTPLLVMVGLAKSSVLAHWRETVMPHTAVLLAIIGLLLFTARSLARQIGRTERTARALQKSNERLAASEARIAGANGWLNMAEQVACVGHWHMEATGRRATTWSDEIYRIFGVNRQSFEPSIDRVLDAYCPESRGRVAAFMAAAVKTGQPYEVEARLIRPDGSVRHVLSRCLPQVDGAGVVTALFGVLMDITSRKRSEAALVEAHATAEAANRALETANRALEAIAMQDALTGLSNRRHFDRALDEEFRRAVRAGTSLALIMIDVDQFKPFNDLYGHPEGDVCLRAIGAAIPNLLNRPGDVAARYGGEEIVVLLPGNTEVGACEVAARIADAVRHLGIVHAGSVHGVVTISAGVEAFVPVHEHDSASDLMQRADMALYAAKEAGRDRVFAFSQVSPGRRSHDAGRFACLSRSAQ